MCAHRAGRRCRDGRDDEDGGFEAMQGAAPNRTQVALERHLTSLVSVVHSPSHTIASRRRGRFNWEVFEFSPQLPATAQTEALEMITPLRQMYSCYGCTGTCPRSKK